MLLDRGHLFPFLTLFLALFSLWVSLRFRLMKSSELRTFARIAMTYSLRGRTQIAWNVSWNALGFRVRMLRCWSSSVVGWTQESRVCNRRSLRWFRRMCRWGRDRLNSCCLFVIKLLLRYLSSLDYGRSKSISVKTLLRIMASLSIVLDVVSSSNVINSCLDSFGEFGQVEGNPESTLRRRRQLMIIRCCWEMGTSECRLKGLKELFVECLGISLRLGICCFFGLADLALLLRFGSTPFDRRLLGGCSYLVMGMLVWEYCCYSLLLLLQLLDSGWHCCCCCCSWELLMNARWCCWCLTWCS